MTFIDRHYGRLLLMIWVVSSALLILASHKAILEWHMGDPDDQLRIVEVRDWLSGQSWFDVSQHRMNLPMGGPMHWSRLVDIPIATIIILAKMFVGQPQAEFAAAIIVPLLTYGLILAIACNIAKTLFGSAAAILVAATLWTSTLVILQMAPMRVDHHAWQIFLFLVCVRALIEDKAHLKAACGIGAALSLWLNISIEGLPFVVFILGLLALRWVIPDKNAALPVSAWPLVSALGVLATGSITLFLAIHGFSDMTTHCDAISPPHLFVFGSVAIVAALCIAVIERYFIPPSLSVRTITLCIAGAAGITMLLSTAPQCAGDAFAGMDPLARAYWYNRVLEGLPLWNQLQTIIVMACGGLGAGFLSSVYVFMTRSERRPRVLIECVLLFVACAVLSLLVYRTAYYALSLGAILGAPLALRLLQSGEAATTLVTRMGWRILMMALLLSGATASVAAELINDLTASQDNLKKQSRELKADKSMEACAKPQQAMALRALSPSMLMSSLDSGPGILQFTKHTIVSTGHHRNKQAMHDVIATFVGSPDAAREIIKHRKIDYIAVCPNSYEMVIYRQNAPDGLWAQLMQNKVPAWLKPMPNIGINRIWKVDLSADKTLTAKDVDMPHDPKVL